MTKHYTDSEIMAFRMVVVAVVSDLVVLLMGLLGFFTRG